MFIKGDLILDFRLDYFKIKREERIEWCYYNNKSVLERDRLN